MAAFFDVDIQWHPHRIKNMRQVSELLQSFCLHVPHSNVNVFVPFTKYHNLLTFLILLLFSKFYAPKTTFIWYCHNRITSTQKSNMALERSRYSITSRGN